MAREKPLLALALRKLAQVVRSQGPSTIRRSDLSHDLRQTRAGRYRPVAGYPWTVKNVEYALQFVPKEKLWMGISVYGCGWFAGDPGKEEKPNPTADYVGRQEVDGYVAAYHPKVGRMPSIACRRFPSMATTCATWSSSPITWFSGTAEPDPRARLGRFLFVGSGSRRSGDLVDLTIPRVRSCAAGGTRPQDDQKYCQ